MTTNPSRIADILQPAAKVLEPPPDRDASQWADAERILPPGSPEPGPWRSSRTPFFIPFMTACYSSLYSTIVFCCGSQMGKTENVLNLAGHRITDGPFVPILFVFPTEKLARSMSNDRFSKMIDSTEILQERLEGGHRNKLMEKFFSGIRLGFAYAGSATELSSHPAGLVLIDEIDRMSDVSGEGDPYLLAKARTKNYTGSKVIITSTPTVKGASRIWQLWESGTMGRWSWPCPFCKVYFVPERSLLIWDDGATPEDAMNQARVICPNCGSFLETKHRDQCNKAGRYEYCLIDNSGGYVNMGPEAPRNPTASFWASGLASPWQSFGEIAYVMQTAINSRDQGTIQGAINTYYGECYEIRGDAPRWEEVKTHKIDYREGEVVENISLITAGVDVQKDRLYYVIRGYGYKHESWLVEAGYIMGETTDDEVWEKLNDLVTATYDGRHINRVFIDSGYQPGRDRFVRPDNKIYIFCRLTMGLCFPTKGRDFMERPVRNSKIDLTISGKTIKGGVSLWHIDTDYFKRQFYSAIRREAGVKFGWHVHIDIKDNYCKQITSEECITMENGQRKWIATRRDNHWLDCEILADAAAYTAGVHNIKNPETPTTPKPPKPAQTTPNTFIKPSGGSFFKR